MENQATQKTLEECEQLIGEGRTEEALKRLLRLKEAKYRRRFTNLSNQYKRVIRQYNAGLLADDNFNLTINQINAGILSNLHELQDLSNNASSKGFSRARWKLVLGVVALATVGVLTYQMLFPSCGEGRKSALFVADFTDGDQDGFSEELRSELAVVIKRDAYNVYQTAYVPNWGIDIDEKIEKDYFRNQCDTSGLFINGFLERLGKSLKWKCYIHIINLYLKTSDLSPGTDMIVLKNPPGIEFEASEYVSAKFITQFISGLLKCYEGKPDEALEKFENLEAGPILKNKSENLQSIVAFYKGTSYAMLGDVPLAKKYFDVAAKDENLKLAALENMGKSEKIAAAMRENAVAIPIAYEDTSTVGSIDSMDQADSSYKSKVDEDLAFIENIDKTDELNQAWEILALLPERDAWTIIRKKPTIETLEGFITKYPKSDHIDEARQKLDILKREIASDKKEIIQNYPAKKFEVHTWLIQNPATETNNSWCPPKCEEFGRVYTWEAAQQVCKEIGQGWKLPTADDWQTLVDQWGGPTDAFEFLIDQGGSEFDAVLGGLRSKDGNFKAQGSEGYYWTSTEVGDQSVVYTFSKDEKVVRKNSLKNNAYSVRCIRLVRPVSSN